MEPEEEITTTRLEIAERMETEDVYLYNDRDDVCVRWDHQQQQWYARYSEDAEFPIDGSTDAVMGAYLGRIVISVADYQTY